MKPWREASRPLKTDMAVYPGDPPFERQSVAESGFNTSRFSMSAHTGTHVDSPAHVGLDGEISLDALNGSAQLLDWRVPDAGQVRSPRVLLQTGGRGLSLAEAQGLLGAGVRLVGTDHLSIGGGDDERAVHVLLLEAGVTILENAAIEDFAPGRYEMQCLPLLMPGSDGAPARLRLREEP